MKRLSTFVFALLLAGSLSFAQGGAGSKGATDQDTTKTAETGKKGHKGGKKGHKGGKKSKKGEKASEGATTPK